MTGDESTALVDAVQTWRYSIDARQHGFFLAKKVRPSWEQHQTQKSIDQDNQSIEETQKEKSRPQTPGTPGANLDFSWKIRPLRSYEEGFFDGVDPVDCFICFADPSNYENHPGWMLRNLLIMIRRRWKLKEAQILCYRDTQARRHEARSIILRATSDPSGSTGSLDMPRVTGWERNISGKVTSKIANLGEYMDPQRYALWEIDFSLLALTRTCRLADQAVDLNLKLIKWRIAPGLDLDSIKDTKCLLLGAGTLGSYVARNLMVCP